MQQYVGFFDVGISFPYVIVNYLAGGDYDCPRPCTGVWTGSPACPSSQNHSWAMGQDQPTYHRRDIDRIGPENLCRKTRLPQSLGTHTRKAWERP